MIMYDWVDCSKEEFDKHLMGNTYRRVPIYQEDAVCQDGILFFIKEPPKPTGCKYQKGINPRQVFVCDTKSKQYEEVLKRLKEIKK